MLIDLCNLQDKNIPNHVKGFYRKATGFNDIVALGEGNDARLYAAMVGDYSTENWNIVEIDPTNPNVMPEIVHEFDTEVTYLVTNNDTLHGIDDEGYVFTLTPWADDDHADYIHGRIENYTGLAIYEDILYGITDLHDGLIFRCKDNNNHDLNEIVQVVEGGFTADWVGITVCDGKLYAMSSMLNLYVYDEDQDKFVMFHCLDSLSRQGGKRVFFGAKKIKGIGKYIYIVDNFWHLWRYDPTKPTEIVEVCQELNNISSICELNGKLYVSQISGGLYQYIPEDLTDPYTLEPEFRIPSNQLFDMCEE